MKTARVRVVGGVPRIEVDGKPTRARIFWGGASASPVPIGAEREITFSFVAPLTTDTATIHFRFGQEPGKVGVREVRIVEVGSGRVVLGAEPVWKVWPPTEESRVEFGRGGFVAQILAPSVGKEWPDFHVFHEHQLRLIKGKTYHVSLRAEGTPARSLTIALYQPGTTYTFLAGPSVQFESQVKLAAAAGVNIVSFEVALPWPAPEEPLDFRASDAACERVLAANPKALLLPRIGVYPPPHWLKSHPDEVMRWDDGDHGGGMVSAASVAYQRDGAARLMALVIHLEKKFGDRLIGYHPTGQNTGEWFWMDSWTGALPGYAACDRVAWDTWRAAQKLPPATVPTPTERKTKTPSATVTDFHRFLSESIADTALAMASAARRASKGKKLSLLFYGYGFEFAPMPSGPANSGHYALHKLLAASDVDMICGPFSYFERGVGGVAPVMSAAESVLAAGKLWLNEDDTRTHLAKERTFPGWDSGADTRENTLGILRRNLAQNACRNHATWWMDLPGTGWFDDPKLWEEMRRFAAWDDYFLAHPTPFRPEIALVLDETAVYSLSPNATQNAPLSTTRKALGLVGAPYGQYLLADVLAGKCPAKVLVILPTAHRAELERAAKGKSLIFVEEKGITTEALRAAARVAGVHLYTQSDAVVFANGPLVAVHAVQDGQLIMVPKRGSKPTTLSFKKGETKLYFSSKLRPVQI